jgi:hypothetical protein
MGCEDPIVHPQLHLIQIKTSDYRTTLDIDAILTNDITQFFY